MMCLLWTRVKETQDILTRDWSEEAGWDWRCKSESLTQRQTSILLWIEFLKKGRWRKPRTEDFLFLFVCLLLEGGKRREMVCNLEEECGIEGSRDRASPPQASFLKGRVSWSPAPAPLVSPYAPGTASARRDHLFLRYTKVSCRLGEVLRRLKATTETTSVWEGEGLSAPPRPQWLSFLFIYFFNHSDPYRRRLWLGRLFPCAE